MVFSPLHCEKFYSKIHRLDPKFAKYATDVFLIGPSGFESPDAINQTSTTVNEIVEDYYRRKQGESLSEDERNRLERMSLASFFKNQEHVEGGGGI